MPVMAFVYEKGWIELMTKPIVVEVDDFVSSNGFISEALEELQSVNHSNSTFLLRRAASRTYHNIIYKYRISECERDVVYVATKTLKCSMAPCFYDDTRCINECYDLQLRVCDCGCLSYLK